MSRDLALKQRLGDRAAHTVVVDRRDPFIRRQRPLWGLPVALVAFVGPVEVWAVIFVLGTGQNLLSPRFVPVTAATAAANLRPTDFSPAMALSTESTQENFADFQGKDINERLFVAGDSAVQSRVALFDFKLIDSPDELTTGGENALHREFEGDELNLDASQSITLGDLGTLRRFTHAAAGREGYVAVFRRGNAYVQLIFNGPPGRFTPEQVTSMPDVIDTRLSAPGAGSR